jgi:parvulin-like peptidyl-prolyl isomerase
MGLDRDDDVIKRRVRQKYELIAEEEDSAAPTEADLEAYLKANPDRFRAPPIVGFTQVMLASEGSATEIESRAEALKAQLAAGADPATAGRSTLLPGRVAPMAVDLVARDFGEPFAAALVTLPEGQWAGPVPSAYGLHLVRIDSRVPAAAPSLASVRAQVQREWENDRRLKAREARLAELRRRYDVVVEP